VNILSNEQQIAVIASLVEGCSIRSVERITGIQSGRLGWRPFL
jgi:hypothetical protein